MEHRENREIGKVIILNPRKFGFIKTDKQEKIFFHYSELPCEFEELSLFSMIEYTRKESIKGTMAINITIVQDALYDKYRMRKGK